MKRFVAAILAALVFASSFGLLVLAETAASDGSNTSPEKAFLLGDTAISDSIPSKDTQRWYKYEMTRDGSFEVCFENTTESQFQQYWYIAVYSSDTSSPINSCNLPGGEPTVLSFDGMTKGDYYIMVTSAQGTNPILIDFSDAGYTLSVCDPLARTGYTGDKVFTYSKAGDVLGVFGGVEFTKYSDGEAFVGYCNTGRSTGPVLVSTDRDSVSYVSEETSTTYSTFEYRYAGSLEYGGEQYYYSCFTGFVDGTWDDEMTPSAYKCIKERTNPTSAAYEILKVAHGESVENISFWAGVESFIVDNMLVVVIVFIVIVAVVAGIVTKTQRNKMKSRVYGGNYTDPDPVTYAPGPAESDAVGDMTIAQGITERINAGVSPDDFPTSIND